MLNKSAAKGSANAIGLSAVFAALTTLEIVVEVMTKI
jgi:hypothetical protein